MRDPESGVRNAARAVPSPLRRLRVLRGVESLDVATMSLIALEGLPGSGKGTVGRALPRALRLPLLDEDDITDVGDGHTPDANALSYDVTRRVARRQLRRGTGEICDSPLSRAQLYAVARARAGETGARLTIVECLCSDAGLWRARIERRRGRDLAAHLRGEWQSVRAHRDAVARESGYAITDPHLVLDTARPLPDDVRDVVAWLRTLEGEERGVLRGKA